MVRLFHFCGRGLACAIAVIAVAGIASAQGTPNPLPRANLTAIELSDFNAGLALFKKDFKPPADPRNENKCSDCHFRPAIGGNGFVYHGAIFHSFTYERPLREFGISRFPATNKDSGLRGTHFVDADKDAIPAWSNAISRRIPRTLFGIGSIEQIPQSAILANADPNDVDRDGISGRALGRFGTQGQFTSIDATIRTVFADELGVSPGNVRNEDVRLIGAFLRGLRDPIQVPLDTAYEIEGQAQFVNLGCASCHTQRFTLSSGRSIEPYSDFLVHDMGSCLDDGVTVSAAQTYEWRTPPLWGLYQNGANLLHDGRGGRIMQVLPYHCGEALNSRNAYLALPQIEQDKLRTFLDSLRLDY